MKIAVWFSCGAASAVAAKKTLELYPDCDVRIVNNPVCEEDRDNLRFLHDVSMWLGRPILQAYNPSFPNASADEVWRKRSYMSGVEGAPCTAVLKKQARQIWERANPMDWHVLGFTLDERKRHDRFVLTERSNVLPVLIDAKITKADCFHILRGAGIKLPAVYVRGYPNANCIGCVKATSPTYWNHVRRDAPDVFAKRAELSRELGVRLVRYQGERVFLDELPPDAMGAPMKLLQNDCSSFCEER